MHINSWKRGELDLSEPRQPLTHKTYALMGDILLSYHMCFCSNYIIVYRSAILILAGADKREIRKLGECARIILSEKSQCYRCHLC